MTFGLCDFYSQKVEKKTEEKKKEEKKKEDSTTTVFETVKKL